jgi:GT2 family glycosyltransferase
MQRQIRAWPNSPKISVILLVDSAAKSAMRPGIDSLLRQVYPNWELVIGSADPSVHAARFDLPNRDARIRIAPAMAPAPAALNSALASATGEYVCLLHQSDELPDHALFQIAQAIVRDGSIDMLYTDEDALTPAGEHVTPFFKPDWSPEYFLAWMYIGQLAVFRAELVRQFGWRAEFDGAHEYDLMLRLFAAGANIQHIPDILYHRRQTTALPPAEPAAKRALESFLDAVHLPGRVEPGAVPGLHRIRHAIAAQPKVSIIIPSACRPITVRDRSTWFALECIAGIRRLSTYRNIEIIVLDNNDMPTDLAAALAPLDIRRIPFTEPFNLARKMNLGGFSAAGEQLILLNDDVEVITPDWIESMLEFSQQDQIGAVGVKLLFPDDTQQHTGVVLLDGNPRHFFYRCPADHPGYFHSSEVHRNWSAVTGACCMTRTEIFKAVGGYSERFPLNYNDVDYCLKVQAIGKRIVYTPHAKLYHHESVSRPEKRPGEATAFRNFWAKRFPRDPYYNPNLARHFRIKLP